MFWLVVACLVKWVLGYVRYMHGHHCKNITDLKYNTLYRKHTHTHTTANDYYVSHWIKKHYYSYKHESTQKVVYILCVQGRFGWTQHVWVHIHQCAKEFVCTCKYSLISAVQWSCTINRGHLSYMITDILPQDQPLFLCISPSKWTWQMAVSPKPLTTNLIMQKTIQ